MTACGSGLAVSYYLVVRAVTDHLLLTYFDLLLSSVVIPFL